MFRRRKPNAPPSRTDGEPNFERDQGTGSGPGGAFEADAGRAAADSPSSAEGKGPDMSTPTPKPPSAGFVPEIPRRAVDIPGAPPRRATPRQTTESKRLVVGRDISLAGEITACDTLVVEGSVEATLENSHSLEIADTGSFKGRVQIDEASIGGRFEGTLTVRGKLSIKSTGLVVGTVRFGQLEVELGGRIKGETAPLEESEVQ